MSSAFDYSGPSQIIEADKKMRCRPPSPLRVNRYHPPVRGAANSQADADKTKRILGKSNSARSQ